MPEPDKNWFSNYTAWAEKAPDNIVACRTSGHKFPEWEDKRAKARIKGGIVYIEVPCLRKCGVRLTRFINPETGYIERSSRIKYDYEDNKYMIPPGARSGGGFTKDMRAVLRIIRLSRLADNGLIETED